MTTLADDSTSPSRPVVAQIHRLAPLLQENAAHSENSRRVADETMEALKAAGAFRVAVPYRHGGSETSLRAMIEVSAAIAESDGSASWVAAVSNYVGWSVGAVYDKEAQDEIWADGPDAVLAGGLAPGGDARKVAGGYRVSASWPDPTAGQHTDWTVSGVFVVNDYDDVIDQGLVAIPRNEFEVEDTRYVAGMQATGSNTIVVADVFVPEHRYTPILPYCSDYYLTGRIGGPLYRSARGPTSVLALVGPQLGLGRAALDLVRRKGADKALAYTTIEHNRDSVAFQLLIAEAALMIDTAHLHAYRAADDVQRYALEAVFPDIVSRARMRGDAAVAVRSITAAISTLLDANGAASFAEGNALQRIWRDSSIAARHEVILPQVSIETYGKALLGVGEHITPIV